MQSGKFQHLLTVEQLVETQNSAGDTVQTWTALTGFVRIMGEVLPDRATEFIAAKQIQATRNALIRLYYRPDITEKMRVVHHKRPGLDEYWEVAGCIDFQCRQTELRLMCVWRDAEGYRRGDDLRN